MQKKSIGVKPKHPLTSKVADVIACYERFDNIANSAFNKIRNQLQARVILMQEFDYVPDCPSCPEVWTKRGAIPLSIEELKACEHERIRERLLIDGYVSLDEIPFDVQTVKGIIGKLKRAGWQITTKRSVDAGVMGYTLKRKPENVIVPKKVKTPSLAGDGV